MRVHNFTAESLAYQAGLPFLASFGVSTQLSQQPENLRFPQESECIQRESKTGKVTNEENTN
jgi:hypothetical protein